MTSLGLWANMPSSYRVRIPAGTETWYEWAAPVALSLAIIAGGWWLANARSIRTGGSRALLWAFGGGLLVAYSAYWVWANRAAGIVEADLSTAVAVHMPWLVLLGFGGLLFFGKRHFPERETPPITPPAQSIQPDSHRFLLGGRDRE